MAAQVIRLVNTAVRRSLSGMFPGYFAGAKHNHYADFGWPVSLEFQQYYDVFRRNGLGKAGVNKTVEKTWETSPFLLEKERDGSEGTKAEETTLEKQIRVRFLDLRVWTKLMECDRRSLVGGYSGVILRFADGGRWEDPVTRVPGGLDGFAGIIPAWAGQLRVSQWDMDQMSETYGEPLMFEFNEANIVDGTARTSQAQAARNMNIHRDRVLVWSEDETVHADSMLTGGYNDLMTLEKIIGAGGQGFWKNAKSAPVLEADPDMDMAAVAKMLNISVEDLVEKYHEQVEAWSKGFDKMLLLQGIEAKAHNVTLPSPEHFFAVGLQSFAASISMPVKILVGMQTGERASTEDANEWAQTNNSRRANVVVPNIRSFVKRLVAYGILPEKDWFVDWTDLTESTVTEKIDRAFKMADVNAKMQSSGEFVFTPEEIRAAADYEPLSESEKYRDDPELEDDPEEVPADA